MNPITLSTRNIYYFKKKGLANVHVYIYIYTIIYIYIYTYIQYPPINKIFPRVMILMRFLNEYNVIVSFKVIEKLFI